jgi:WD40 repeat protein
MLAEGDDKARLTREAKLALQRLRQRGVTAPGGTLLGGHFEPPAAEERVAPLEHKDSVTRLAVSPDGKLLASTGADKTLRLWDLANGKERWHSKRDDDDASTLNLTLLAFSRDGKKLRTAEPLQVMTWDILTGKPLSKMAIPDRRAEVVSFLDDGAALLTHRPASIVLRDGETGKEQRSFSLHDDGDDTFGGMRWGRINMTCLDASADGTRLLTGRRDQIRLWDVKSGEELAVLRGVSGEVWALALSPDKQAYAWVNREGELAVGDVLEKKPRFRVQFGDRDPIALAFSPDGKQLACGARDGTVSIFRAEGGKELHRINAHRGGVLVLTYTPDGKTLVSGGRDCRIRVLDTTTGKEKAPVVDN